MDSTSRALSPPAWCLSPYFAEAPTHRGPRGENEHLLHTVLDNMAQGVLMFDAGRAIGVLQSPYLKMYGLTQELAKPGCTLRDLLHHAAADPARFSGDPRTIVAKLDGGPCRRKPFCDVVNSGDGRVFSIVNTPVAGGGWVATHEDITERRAPRSRSRTWRATTR